MELQNAFYIIGIVFMSLMLVLFVALVVAVFAIRSKISSIHDSVNSKLSIVSNLAESGKEVVSKVKRAVRR